MHWREAIPILTDLAAKPGRLGLITDVDGTISPIVDQPDAAQVTPRNRELLSRLESSLPLVAVISGRSAEDVHARLDLPGLVYIGNHGLERWVDGQIQIHPEASRYRPALEKARADIQAFLQPGMLLEDKGATLSLHYRQAKQPDQVAIALQPKLQQLANSHGLWLTAGRRVFEFRPPIKIDKGTAFRGLVKEYRLDCALYLGDDTTDITALLAARSLREERICQAYGLGVKSDGTPEDLLANADFWIGGVQEVESFLAWLLKARMTSST
jgi:trehalose 6-phosphate phosphatase